LVIAPLLAFLLNKTIAIVFRPGRMRFVKNVARIAMWGINATYYSENPHEKGRLGNLRLFVKVVLKCVEINGVWIGLNWLKMVPHRRPFLTRR
jgi:hypothetical protein